MTDRLCAWIIAAALLLCVWGCTPAQAQTAAVQNVPAPPAERPGDVYKELMQPLEQVRGSLDNWSPAEMAALAAGVRRAQEYCRQVSADAVSGDDLYQLARVCSVGQEWSAADAAAAAYIKSASQPYQASAYAIRINALINLKDTTMAVELARSMLAAVPYDATVDQSMSYLIHYLAMSLDDAALPLAEQRQPLLLIALGSGALREQAGDAAIGAAELYSEGLELAYLEQYAGEPTKAQQARTALDAALAKLPEEKIDNQAEIAQARRRYALVGKKLPPIQTLRYTAPGSPPTRIHADDGKVAVLLFFPTWCAQCRQMMQPMNSFLTRNSGRIHACGVLALDAEEAANDPFQSERFKDLQHTPTLTTGVATLESFGAERFPFVVITDDAGTIRFLGTVAQNAFDPEGFVEQFIERKIRKGAPGNTSPANH